MLSSINRWGRYLLCLLLVTDLAFITLHCIHVYSSWLQNPLYSIELDRGYAEFFQYTKSYWCVFVLAAIAFQKRLPHYLSWALLFLYILLDDITQFHEAIGSRVAKLLGFTEMFNLRPRDLGELVTSAVMALGLFLCIALAYRYGDRAFRSASKFLILMMLVLAGCGVFVDMLHIAIKIEWLARPLGILEDGGEMIVMSMSTAFIFGLVEPISSNSSVKRNIRAAVEQID